VRLRLLSAGAAQGLVQARAPAFKIKTGAGIDATFGAVGTMKAKLQAGEPADVLILTEDLMRRLVREGYVLKKSLSNLGVVRTSIAARKIDAMPEIATVAQLQAALLAAPAIHLADPAQATAGIHFAGIIDKLALRKELASRLRPHPNGMTAMAALATATERGALGCTQATEIVATLGVQLVGPLPGETGLATTYTAGICAQAQNPDLAREFKDFLTDDENLNRFGFEQISVLER
jgi:molybdate transport system substrate-binding protein